MTNQLLNLLSVWSMQILRLFAVRNDAQEDAVNRDGHNQWASARGKHLEKCIEF